MEVQTPQGEAFHVELANIATVAELKAAVAKHLKCGQVRLACGGTIVRETDILAEIQNKGPIIAMVMSDLGRSAEQRPNTTTNSGLQSSATAEKEDDDLSLRLPANAPTWKKQFVSAGRQIYVPDPLLQLLLSVRWTTWLKLVIFAGLLPVANSLGVGPIYIIAVICILIFSNLGKRREGEASAYSIFNNFKTLPGQLTGQEVDRQVRHGQAI